MGENKELLKTMEMCGHFLYHRRGGKRGQARILNLLIENGEMSQRRIQDIIDIKSGSLSELVRKMEAEGLISREKDETDRRNITIKITPKGIQRAEENSQILKKQEQVMFNSLSEHEQEQLYTLLKKLIEDWNEKFAKKELES
ncbi:MAG: MarR family winged helix-turn-helix transcriptional regulator [Lachnospiraceae bacterium]